MTPSPFPKTRWSLVLLAQAAGGGDDEGAQRALDELCIARGHNFFGQPSAAGDHDFSPTSFATKIRAVGIAFEGYIGMDDPSTVGGAVGGIGGASPPDPDLGFLDPDGLKGTPYVYLETYSYSGN